MIHLNADLWLAMGVYWLVSARNVNANVRKESFFSRSLHLAPTGFAFYVLFNDTLDFGFFGERIVRPTLLSGILGNVLTALSLAFAIWARHHLGRYWSAAVTLKEGHRLIRTGPYRYVRHPIYTGLLFGILGTALIQGKVLGFLALLMLLPVYARKIRLEEKVLLGQFGDEYRRYQREVRALIPFVF